MTTDSEDEDWEEKNSLKDKFWNVKRILKPKVIG